MFKINIVRLGLIIFIVVGVVFVLYYWSIALPAKEKKTWHALRALNYEIKNEHVGGMVVGAIKRVPFIGGEAMLVSATENENYQWLYLQYLQRNSEFYIYNSGSLPLVAPSAYCRSVLSLEHLKIGRQVKKKLKAYC